MNFKNSFKPIEPIYNFINYRRDTFLYVGVVGVVAVNSIFGFGLEAWGINTKNACQVIGGRETLRGVAWAMPFWGGPINIKYTYSATAFGLVPGLLGVFSSEVDFSSPKTVISAGVLTAVGAMVSTMRGGPMAVVRDYGEIMWDWPGRNRPRRDHKVRRVFANG